MDAEADALIERIHEALGTFFKGDPGPTLELFSQEEDVTLGNPFGPFVRGWERVRETATAAAGHYRDGEVVGFERLPRTRPPTSPASSKWSGIARRSARARRWRRLRCA